MVAAAEHESAAVQLAIGKKFHCLDWSKGAVRLLRRPFWPRRARLQPLDMYDHARWIDVGGPGPDRTGFESCDLRLNA